MPRYRGGRMADSTSKDLYRIIIEGMDRDNTRINFLTNTMKAWDLHTGIVVVEPSWGKTALFLRGHLDSKKYVPVNANKLSGRVAHFETGPFPESIQSIIVEDGRVYSGAHPSRLDETIMHIDSWGGFDKLYARIEKDPNRFYH